jgi:Na+-driven multidrug efflux pump
MNRLDLTEGSIFKTLVKLAVPVTVSMVLFTVYLLVDLYFDFQRFWEPAAWP